LATIRHLSFFREWMTLIVSFKVN